MHCYFLAGTEKSALGYNNVVYYLLLKCAGMFEGTPKIVSSPGLGLNQLINKAKFQQKENKISPYYEKDY